MADAEEQERLKLQRKRELRRRKLLQNANSRMEKLKGIGRSPSADPTTAGDEALRDQEVPLNKDPDPPSPDPLSPVPDPLSPVPDPPDELIERRIPHSTQTPAPPPPSQPRGRLLSVLVATAQSSRWLAIRTILSAITALCCAVSTHSAAIATLSPVSCTVLLDASLLLFIALSSSSSSSRPPPPSPLGKLAVVKLTLYYMLPSLANSFETLCLSVFLGAIVLRDLCTCVFFSVASIAVLSLFIS